MVLDTTDDKALRGNPAPKQPLFEPRGLDTPLRYGRHYEFRVRMVMLPAEVPRSPTARYRRRGPHRARPLPPPSAAQAPPPDERGDERGRDHNYP